METEVLPQEIDPVLDVRPGCLTLSFDGWSAPFESVAGHQFSLWKSESGAPLKNKTRFLFLDAESQDCGSCET